MPILIEAAFRLKNPAKRGGGDRYSVLSIVIQDRRVPLDWDIYIPQAISRFGSAKPEETIQLKIELPIELPSCS